ncbi:MAG: ParB/RepB/Spo0J family partition protein [Flavobacteriales bacterium]|jgi:ParB family transcriptional regulator, chromosome partitioning protein|nr:ParB/RepB/Spo0J family partition protein [Flavobacteriales bacterium]
MMSNRRNALGRGLSAILRSPNTDITNNKNEESKLVGTINEISLGEIQINPFQPRVKFDEDKIYELSQSIKELGIIQPITVRKLGYNRYQLISGERRFKASKTLNLRTIPAYIRIANDEQMLEMALVENIQRENLNPIEIAISFQRLIKECSLTQEECGNKLGKQRSTITNFLRLLKLPLEIQDGLKRQKISVGHARALININDTTKQLNIFNDIIENGFSVREVEQLVKDFAERDYNSTVRKKQDKNTETLLFSHQKMLFDLSKSLDKRVQLTKNKKGNGKIIIPFSNDDELTSIFNKINT